MTKDKNDYHYKVDDIYYNLTRITSEVQKEEWLKYSENAGYELSSLGVSTFQKALKFWNNLNTEVWVSYVSNKFVSADSNINDMGIEMYLSVTTSKNVPFTTHMGIQRVPCENSHKNIAVSLHEFCAKIMHERYPDKLFMINTPMEVMREILINKIKLKNGNEAFYIYENEDSFIFTPNRIKHLKNLVDSSEQKKEGFHLKLLSKLHLAEDMLNQKDNIKNGKIFPQLIFKQNEQENNVLTLFNKNDGKNLATLESNNPEFDWFFKSYDLISVGINNADAPMISIDLSVLGDLSNQFTEELY